MKLKLVAFRLITLIALAACCASLLDHLLPSPAFCGFKAGCDEVVNSAFGSLLGIPLSAWGLMAFGVFYVLTLFPGTLAAKLVGPAAIIAGLGGLALVLIQAFLLKQFCPLCLITDAAALLLAAVELGVSPAKQAPAKPFRPRRWLWAGAAIIAVGGPVLWPLIQPIPPVPEQVKAYWQAGKITVVEVTDFECPYCRKTHPALAEFLEQHDDRLAFVRLVQPMEKHANALHAARAYLCVERQHQAEAMGTALFEADDLSEKDCERLAESQGLDMDDYRQCVADPKTDAQIRQLTGWVEQAHIDGLPVIWIQDQRLMGEQTVASLRAALKRAERRYDAAR
ncbi:MAG: thioredoxin domain-containing protein [Pirellulaceae bacterium]|nr:thioredoxin domain-containing protein [Pirellulaceae bacterium]